MKGSGSCLCGVERLGFEGLGFQRMGFERLVFETHGILGLGKTHSGIKFCAKMLPILVRGSLQSDLKFNCQAKMLPILVRGSLPKGWEFRV